MMFGLCNIFVSHRQKLITCMMSVCWCLLGDVCFIVFNPFRLNRATRREYKCGQSLICIFTHISSKQKGKYGPKMNFDGIRFEQ